MTTAPDSLVADHTAAADEARRRVQTDLRLAAAAAARADADPTLHGAAEALREAYALLRAAEAHATHAAESAANAALAAEIECADGAVAARARARALNNEAADLAMAANEADMCVAALELYAGMDAEGDDDSAHQADECARLIHNLAATIAALPCTEAP